MKNKKKLEKIAAALELEKGDTVIEIGPGHGELTEKLKAKNLKLKIIAIEKDRNLISPLKEKFPEVEIIEGDALKVLPDLCFKIQASRFKICGNIPYYITGHLLRILSELDNKPRLAVLTIQKEVAERICAAPPKMNLLAAITQFWAEAKIIGFISRKDFSPPPEVDSAIIKLQTADYKQTTKQAEKYCKFAKIIFKQPRKTIINNLCAGYGDLKKEEISEKLRKAGINPQNRPQNLKVEQIASLSTLF